MRFRQKKKRKETHHLVAKAQKSKLDNTDYREKIASHDV